MNLNTSQFYSTLRGSTNRTAVIILLALGLLGPAASSRAQKLVSAEKTSFQEVTSQLDPGGTLYAYLSTEQLLQGISDKISGARAIVSAVPNVKPEDQEKINKAFDIVTHLVKNSGIEDVSGFGASSIATEKGLYHSKLVLHHYKGKGSGFLWSMFGQKAHPLDGLDLLPTNTVVAAFCDLDMPLLWSVIQREVTQSGIPQAQQFLDKVPEAFEKATGLSWDKVLASLGNQYGLVVTLNDTKKITLPAPGGDPLEIPEPALMLVFKVKDDLIFNRIDQVLKQTGQPIESTDKPNLKARTVPLPIPFLPLNPTIARSGDYLFVATSDELVQEAVAVKAGQTPGLKTTAEFKHLSKDVPQQGNSFSFVSQRLGKTITQLQERALANAEKDGKELTWFRSFLKASNAAFSYSVATRTDQGWLVVGNGNQHPAKVVAVSAVVPAAIAAGVALPAIAKAKARAQQIQAKQKAEEQ